MTREALNLLSLVSTTKVGDLLNQPPYAFVVQPSDLSMLRDQSPPVDAVKPSAPVR